MTFVVIFYSYVFEGLGHLVSSIFINSTQYFSRINENGIKKMWVHVKWYTQIDNKTQGYKYTQIHSKTQGYKYTQIHNKTQGYKYTHRYTTKHRGIHTHRYTTKHRGIHTHRYTTKYINLVHTQISQNTQIHIYMNSCRYMPIHIYGCIDTHKYWLIHVHTKMKIHTVRLRHIPVHTPNEYIYNERHKYTQQLVR